MNNDEASIPTKIERDELLTIYKNALADPSLKSTVDVSALLESIDKTKTSYLENKTIDNIRTDIDEKLRSVCISSDQFVEFHKKLLEYRYVDEIHQLHKGKHVRWIRTGQKTTLTNGGIIVDVRFLDNGTHVLCMNAGKRFIQYKFDDCITFQKMTTDEQMILHFAN